MKMKRFEFGVRRTYCFSAGIFIGLWWLDLSFGFFSIQFTYNTKEDIEEYYTVVERVKEMDEADDLS